ncbi:MAG: hypothetical protein NVS4B11_15670 [Ktedonobacteraceae bacterium]
MNAANRPQILGAIKIMAGKQAGSTFQIVQPRIRIGRQPGNDIIISNETVSREHAEITWDGMMWWINKLTQANTLFVNNNEVQREQLLDQDEVLLGADVKIRFFSYVRPANAPNTGVAPTVFRQTPHQLPPIPPNGGGTQGVTDPLHNLGHSAWQLVSLIAAGDSIIFSMETAIRAGTGRDIIQGFTAFLGLLACVAVIYISRKKPAPATQQKHASQPLQVAQGQVLRATTQNPRRSFRLSLLINIVMLALFVIDITVFYNSITTLGLTFLLFLVSLLIAFLNIVIRVPRTIRTNVAKGRTILWSAGIVAIASFIAFILDIILIAVAPYLKALVTGIFFALIALFIESIVVLIVAAIVVSMKPANPQYSQQPHV